MKGGKSICSCREKGLEGMGKVVNLLDDLQAEGGQEAIGIS
jgi:hypothetical protein